MFLDIKHVADRLRLPVKVADKLGVDPLFPQTVSTRNGQRHTNEQIDAFIAAVYRRGYAILPLTKGKAARIDVDLFPDSGAWSFYRGKPCRHLRRGGKLVQQVLVDWVWQETYAEVPRGRKIINADGDVLNCLASNLIVAPEFMRDGKFRGIYFRAGKYEAWAMRNGIWTYIGRYETEEAAIAAKAKFLRARA